MNGKISNFAQVANLRRYTYTEGKERDLQVIDCDNGKIRFLLNASKALDIMQLYCDGKNVSFLSKNAFTKREVPFIRRFEGGMLYTCGLDGVGGVEGHELHGNLHNTTPNIVRAECSEEGIIVEAIMRDSELFGKNLVLRRKIFSAIGSNSLELTDTLVNEGYADEEYCLLYHVNAGYPLLDENCRIEADIVKATPRDVWAKERLPKLTEITPAVPCEAETCYFLTLKTPQISLVNKKSGRKFTLSYDAKTLPKFVLWKSMACGDYALGMEPCSTELDGGFHRTVIKAGESINFKLNMKAE